MAALSEAEVRACTHPRQFSRFLLSLIFCLLLVAVVIFYLVVAVPAPVRLAFYLTLALVVWLFVFLVWLLRETAFAYFKGNSILVSELNYPRINALTEELKETLSVSRPVVVFVYEQGVFNAMMQRLFFRRAVLINSEILETGVTDDEVRWVVGRFIGYLRAYRRSGAAGWLIHMVQVLGFTSIFTLPYDRALVYTGDRLAVGAIGGDISTAASAMQKALVGRQLGYSVNPVGLVEQHRTVKGSIFAFWGRLLSPFPHTTARYVDMLAFAKRHYPEQFGRFEAANPGLASDIEFLSSEYANPGDFVKGIGVYIGLLALVAAVGGLTFLAWQGVIADMMRQEQIKEAVDANAIAANAAMSPNTDSGMAPGDASNDAEAPPDEANTAASPDAGDQPMYQGGQSGGDQPSTSPSPSSGGDQQPSQQAPN